MFVSQEDCAMITREQIDQLLGFRDGEYLVSSCYLNLDRSKMPAQMLKIRTKDLLQSAHHQLAAKAATHNQRESLRKDFDEIEAFVMPEIVANRHKAVAIFSCAGEKFWQAFGLPRMVRNILIADHDPYIRPLTAILAEYHRYCVVLVDRVHGQIFEVYLGDILQRSDVVDAVPRRVREGGFGGRSERNMERRHGNAVLHHYRRVADEIFRIFKKDQFDWLILGGQREPLLEFKNYLHPYLRSRWVGDFHGDPKKITSPEVLRQAMAIEERVEWEHEQRLAEELVQKAQAGDRAVKGVTATLTALDRGEAQTLLVEEGFEMPGYACFGCHYVSLEPGDCPHCHKPVEPCADVVDEAIELALQRNCQIEHLQGATPLREGGRIGALLRYQAA
jgi:peptide subunit release factor 1 (eRF1)